MKEGKTLQEMAIELDRQEKAKRDLVVETGALALVEEPDGLRLEVASNDLFGVNDIAHRQIGQHLKIPATYYDRMRFENPELLATNVNTWFAQEPKTRRMLRTMDGTARAFLSDRYRRLDNYAVASTVLPILSGMDGATVESCELTDSRMYIKVVNQRITAEISKGDIVQAGISISNSEVGLGSVCVRPLIYRLVCSNGMIAVDSSVRKYHVGRVNETIDGAYDIFRDETIEADDQAFLMKIEDVVNAAVDQAVFSRIVDRLRESTQAKLEPAAVPAVVELTGKEFGLNQPEREGILGHLIAGGDLSLYGLGNAVTRHAQEVASYDRSTEMEVIGYKIATMPSALFNRITAQSRR